MPLLIEDEKIDALAERYQAVIHAPSKQDAVRQALEVVLNVGGEPNATWIKVEEIQKRLRDASPLAQPLPDDTEYVSALYESRQ